MIPLSEATDDVPKAMDIETKSDTEDATLEEVKKKDHKRKRNEGASKSKRQKTEAKEGKEAKEKKSRTTVVTLTTSQPPTYATEPTRVFTFCAGAGCEEKLVRYLFAHSKKVPFPTELKVFKKSLKLAEEIKVLLVQGHTARAFENPLSYRGGRKELVLAIGRTPDEDAAFLPTFQQQQAEKKQREDAEKAHQERLQKIRELAAHRGADYALDSDVDAIEQLMTPGQLKYWHRELLKEKRKLLESVVRHWNFERAR